MNIPNKWLLDPIEVEESVLAETRQRQHRVEHVLVAAQEVDPDGERQYEPAPCRPAHVQEDEHESRPESREQRHQADDQPQHHRRLHDVAKRLRSQEARKGIPLHSLEDIVLSCIEDFRVVAALLFDVLCDLVENALRQDDLALGAREKEGVENLFC